MGVVGEGVCADECKANIYICIVIVIAIWSVTAGDSKPDCRQSFCHATHPASSLS